MSRREIDRHVCKDCGVNVIKIGEYCMINPALWKDKLGLGWDDNLCIGCIEKRLGRKLRGMVDFIASRKIRAAIRGQTATANGGPVCRAIGSPLAR